MKNTVEWTPGLQLNPVRRITTFDVIYHICPFVDSERWKWNVEQLLKRIDVFNGVRAAAIVTGYRLEDPDVVKEFVGHDFTFIVKENKREDGERPTEAITFWDLLKFVQTIDVTRVTFFAHTKGVSKPNQVQLNWAEVMYAELLDDMQRVRQAMESKGMLGVDIDYAGPYLFPGTFWWFHNATLFNKDWENRENTITSEGPAWSVEALPNKLFNGDNVSIKHQVSLAGAT